MVRQEQAINQLGIIFEVAFNVGIMATLENLGIRHHDDYTDELKLLHPNQIIKYYTEELSKEYDTETLDRLGFWCNHILLYGMLVGKQYIYDCLDFFDLLHPRKRNCLSVELYLANFYGVDNGFGIPSLFVSNSKDKNKQRMIHWLKREFDIHVEEESFAGYDGKGEWLNCDCLIILKSTQKTKSQYNLICADTSLFTGFYRNYPNPKKRETLQHLLKRIKLYLSSRHVFNNIGYKIDPEKMGISQEKIRQHLQAEYLEAKYDRLEWFAGMQNTKGNLGESYSDKEIYKLIQAGAYAHSFQTFLKSIDINIFQKDSQICCSGVSDRQYNNMTGELIKPSYEQFLKSCHEVYKKSKGNEAIRRSYLDGVIQNLSATFDKDNKDKKIISRKIYKKLEALKTHPNSNEITITHYEKWEKFNNIVAMRDPHRDEILKCLKSYNVLFLTGCPGIGKTTTLRDYTQTLESYTCLYFSSRTAVNKDFARKWYTNTGEHLIDDKLVVLNTDSALIRQHQGGTVYCRTNNPERLPKEGSGIKFTLQEEPDESFNYYSKFIHLDDGTIVESEKFDPGVYHCLFKGIGYLISQKISNKIVGIATTQALRSSKTHSTTFEHFKKIFGVNKKDFDAATDKNIRETVAKNAKYIGTLILIIDEITADENGAHFLKELMNIIRRLGLDELVKEGKFNLKIAIADASLTEQSVIEDYLAKANIDYPKVYIQRPLSIEPRVITNEFNFAPLSALGQSVLINVNGYPAKALNVEYTVLIGDVGEREEHRWDLDRKALDYTRDKIIEICKYDRDAQIIVFIQNKSELIKTQQQLAKELELDSERDIILIHADVADKTAAIKTAEDAQIILMTSSGARGLSFPKSCYCIVHISLFELERNLLEVVQGIYRGRGKQTIDRDREKNLYFILRYQPHNIESELEYIMKNTLNILSSLIYVKLSVMTRIYGYGRLGKNKENRISIIPVGNKCLSGTARSLPELMRQSIESCGKQRMQPTFEKNTRASLSIVEQKLREIFSCSTTGIEFKPETGVITQKLREIYIKLKENRSLAEIVKLIPTLKCRVMGYNLLIDLSEAKSKSDYEIFLSKIFKLDFSNLQYHLKVILKDKNIPPDLKADCRDLREILRKLEPQTQKSQNLSGTIQSSDSLYLVFPFLQTMLDIENISQNLESLDEEKESMFHILKQLTRAYYPSISIVAPTVGTYEKNAFMLFTSPVVNAIDRKAFDPGAFLMTPELSILGLLI